jgi:hypothetical protein
MWDLPGPSKAQLFFPWAWQVPINVGRDAQYLHRTGARGGNIYGDNIITDTHFPSLRRGLAASLQCTADSQSPRPFLGKHQMSLRPSTSAGMEF